MSLEHAPRKKDAGAWCSADQVVPLLLSDLGVAAMLGCSRPTVWRRVADGTLPKAIKIGGLTRWPRDEIIAVIERAKAARDGEAV